MTRVFLILSALILTSCSEDDAVFSVKSSASYWQTICIDIENDIVACYGPGWSSGVERKKENYDFYKLSIEKRDSGGGLISIHSRRFEISEVRQDVLNRYSTDVVEIDSSSRVVKFHIADAPYEYKL